MMFSNITKLLHFHSKYFPSVEELAKIEEVCAFYRIFKVATTLISGLEYATSNLFLPELFRIKTILDEKLAFGNEQIRGMVRAMRYKYNKY